MRFIGGAGTNFQRIRILIETEAIHKGDNPQPGLSTFLALPFLNKIRYKKPNRLLYKSLGTEKILF